MDSTSLRTRLPRFLGILAAVLLLGSSADLRTDAGSRRLPVDLAALLQRADHNCRLWGLTGEYPAGIPDDHLRTGAFSNFKELSFYNPDGWGIVSFPTDPGASALQLPLARRGGVYAANIYDPDFDISVGELSFLRPSAVLAHIRTASSGHDGVPDPHPFVREGFAFAHNGRAPDSVLVEMLTEDDPAYLVTHPPAYTIDYIDSELYFLWLLKYRHLHPALPILDALQQAVSLLYSRVSPDRLNFVLTRGDTLWACRCAGYDANDPLRYYPGEITPPPPYWAVCSAVVGSDSLGWGTFAPLSLGMFVPGQAPVFVPVAAPGEVPDRGDRSDDTDAPAAGEWLGRPRPNPAGDAVELPIRAVGPPAPARIDVWNAAGARVWRAEAVTAVSGPGGAAYVWPCRDDAGRRVPPGVYYCRIEVGGRQAERKVTVVR